MPGEAPAPMYCAHMTGDGCELSNCEEHECHLDDREDVEIRMPDPNTEHGLRVQLATALRERDTQKARAEKAEAELARMRADFGHEQAMHFEKLLRVAGVRVLVEPCERGGHYLNENGVTFHPSKCAAPPEGEGNR